MKIILGSDHGGFALKQVIKQFLSESGYVYEDLGCLSEDACDYPEFGRKVAQECIRKKSFGIIVCGTGIGISIAANKVEGARCALCMNSTLARLARQHNDANVLALGGRIIGDELAKDIVKVFLSTPFSQEKRHINRVAQLS